MAKNAPGKHYRKGLTLAEFFWKFPDDVTAEAWFTRHVGPTGRVAHTAIPTASRATPRTRPCRTAAATAASDSACGPAP